MTVEWPADRVERRPIEGLIPYARNARTHSEEQVAQIAASIREWGWTVPVLVDEAGGIIAGHGRVLAARKLELADVPVVVASGWSEAQKRAYILADNKLALNAGWDSALLASELRDIAALGFDAPLIGFSADELAALAMGGESPGEDQGEDNAPEPPVNPVTKPGDLWILGRHRLLCGDSTSPQDIERLMAGQEADLCFTSPPYGNQRDYKSGGKGHWAGDRKQTTLWSIPSRDQDAETTHGTQKPVACMRRPIENNSSPGQAVYEPFSGSGTTIIAAEMSGRACHAIELSPAYVDVAVLRWQDFTGEAATLDGDGRTFAEIAAERLKSAA